MTRKEMKTAKDSEIIVDYIDTMASYCLNLNGNGKIDRLSKHLDDLDSEMLRRFILTPQQIKHLRS